MVVDQPEGDEHGSARVDRCAPSCSRCSSPSALFNLPLELRTLALTVVLVPLMVFILVPGLTWIALAAQATFGPHGHRPHDPGSPRSTSGSER